MVALCVLNLDNQTPIQRGDMRTVGFLLSSEMPMETEELSDFRPELASAGPENSASPRDTPHHPTHWDKV